MSDLMLDVGQANELKYAMRRASATPDEVKRMGEGDFMKGVVGLLRGEFILTPVAKAVVKLLELVGEVVVSATTEVFVSKEKFIVLNSSEALVKISYIGYNFTNWFLQGDGKVEAPIGEQTLRYAKLRQHSVDTPIIDELGGEDKAETTLTELYGLMWKQRNGEAGALLNNGWANIFYIKDQLGLLRMVHVSWNDDGWNVNAGSTSSPHQWFDGHQVFSRCS